MAKKFRLEGREVFERKKVTKRRFRPLSPVNRRVRKKLRPKER